MTAPAKLDVLFRATGPRKQPEITAVFPTECGTSRYDMTCYAHVGQHSVCQVDWYRETRKAKPEEYADLLAELSQVYAPEYELVVKQKITPQHRAKREAQEKAYTRAALAVRQ